MKKLFFFSLYLLLNISPALSQFAGVKQYNNSGTFFTPRFSFATADSGFILAGASRDSISHVPASCIKLDKNGILQWQFHHIIGSSTWIDGFELPDGSFVLGTDKLVIRHSASGTFLWKKVFSFHQWNDLSAMCPGNNSTVVLIGNTYEHVPWFRNFWTTQLDTSGNILNATEYELTIPHHIIIPVSITSDNSGLMALGTVGDSIPNIQYPVFLKFDGDGNLLFNKSYPFTDPNLQGSPQKIVSDNTGNYYFTSFDEDFSSILLGKIDSSANFVWLRQIQYTGMRPGDLTFTKDRKIVLTNNYYDYPTVGTNLLELDSTGAILENRYYSNCYSNSIIELKNQHLVSTGYDFVSGDNGVVFPDTLLHLPCRDSSISFNVIDVPFVNPLSFSFTKYSNLKMGQINYGIYSGVLQETILCDSSFITSVNEAFPDDYSVTFTSGEMPHLNISSPSSTKINLEVFTLTGALLFSQKSICLTPGENLISLDFRKTSSALSLVRITGDRFCKSILLPVF